MTIKELIIELKKQPNQDALVVTNGYEGGYRDVTEARPLPLILNINTEWYYGPHEKADLCENGVPAIVL